MTGFGEELRAERTRRGLTLDMLSVQTKVPAHHLEAMERGDLLALPGGVFRKGIVRAYVAALGLDEEQWLARYQADWNAIAQAAAISSDEARRAEQDAWAIFATNVQRGRGGRQRGGGIRWAGVLGLFIALAVTAWLLWRTLHLGPAHTLGPVRKISQGTPILPGGVPLSGSPVLPGSLF